MRCTVLIVLLLVGTVLGKWVNNGCMDDFQPFESQFCVSITPPGTWMEAISSCQVESSPIDSIVYFQDGDVKHQLTQKNIIKVHGERLKQMLSDQGVEEVWWKQMDSILLTGDTNVILNEEVSQLHTAYLSRWKWSNSSESACETYNLKDATTRRRSCSPVDSKLKFSFFCVRVRHEEKEFVNTSSCPKRFFSGYDADKYCYMTIDVTQDSHDTTMQNDSASFKDFSNEHLVHLHGYNKSVNWQTAEDICFGQGVNVSLLQRGYRHLIGSTIKYCSRNAIFPLGVKSIRDGQLMVWVGNGTNNQDIVDEVMDNFDDIPTPPHYTRGAVNLTSGALYMVNNESTYQCVLCQTRRHTDMEPLLSLRHTNGQNLTLTFSNYNGQPMEAICYTDSSNTNFSLPNYKRRKLSIRDMPSSHGPENKVYVFITEETTSIDDVYFLRMNGGKVKQLSKTELSSLGKWNYAPERGDNCSDNTEIQFTAFGSGNHWCMGINKITRRPIFTEKISVVLPNDGSYSRYSVLVEKLEGQYDVYRPMLLAPIDASVSLELAKVLHVIDGVIELKIITHHDTLFLFHVTLPTYHSPLEHTPLSEVMEGFRVVSIKNHNECLSKKITEESRTHILPDGKTGQLFLQEPLLRDNCVESVYVCENADSLDGASWQEVYPSSSKWQKEWGKPCRFIAEDAINALHRLSGTSVNSNRLPEVTNLIDMLMRSSSKFTTRHTHALHDIDQILTNMVFDKSSNGVVQHVRSGVAVLVSDLSQDNPRSIVGFSLESHDGRDILHAIRSNDNPGEQDHPNETEIRVIVPRAIIRNKSRLAFSVFSNAKAFEDDVTGVHLNSRILNIILSNGNDAISTFNDGQFVDIEFRPIRTHALGLENKKCAFWDLEKRSWSEEGCVLHLETESGMDVCRCYHLTHFAQIITGGGSPLPPGHQKALEVISIIGCTLSLFGLLVIVVTAIVFKNWRVELGNKILLNLSAALALNLVVFLLVHGGVGGNSGPDCITIGVLLHYSILACFCWMLVMSGLQVMRLLTMLGNKGIPKLLLKACGFGWGVPLVPIIILLAIEPTIYTSTSTMGFDRGFCYPTGTAFYLTVAAPVGIIVLINIVIYIIIICRICSCFGWGALNTGLQRHGLTDGLLAMRRLRTLIFLFFLFGITWTFGFLVEYLFFAYLFCITATLQGFVIFIFFFVIEKKSWGYWRNKLFDLTATGRSYKSTDTFGTTEASAATKSTHFSESVPLRNQVDKSTSIRNRNREVSVISEHRTEDRPTKESGDVTLCDPVPPGGRPDVHLQAHNEPITVDICHDENDADIIKNLPSNEPSLQHMNVSQILQTKAVEPEILIYADGTNFQQRQSPCVPQQFVQRGKLGISKSLDSCLRSVSQPYQEGVINKLQEDSIGSIQSNFPHCVSNHCISQNFPKCEERQDGRLELEHEILEEDSENKTSTSGTSIFPQNEAHVGASFQRNGEGREQSRCHLQIEDDITLKSRQNLEITSGNPQDIRRRVENEEGDDKLEEDYEDEHERLHTPTRRVKVPRRHLRIRSKEIACTPQYKSSEYEDNCTSHNRYQDVERGNERLRSTDLSSQLPTADDLARNRQPVVTDHMCVHGQEIAHCCDERHLNDVGDNSDISSVETNAHEVTASDEVEDLRSHTNTPAVSARRTGFLVKCGITRNS